MRLSVGLLLIFLLCPGALCSEDEPPVFKAVSSHDSDAVKRLIAAGKDINAQDLDGDTPLLHAAKYGYMGLIRILIKAGADANIHNREGDTPLLVAVSSKDFSLVSTLVEAGADVNQRLKDDYWGFVQPLHRAAYYGDTEMTALLLFYGADPNLTVRENKLTPFQRVVLGATNPTPAAPSGKDVDHAGTARVLLATGADICAKGGAKRANHLKYLDYAKEKFNKNNHELKRLLELYRCIDMAKKG